MCEQLPSPQTPPCRWPPAFGCRMTWGPAPWGLARSWARGGGRWTRGTSQRWWAGRSRAPAWPAPGCTCRPALAALCPALMPSCSSCPGTSLPAQPPGRARAGLDPEPLPHPAAGCRCSAAAERRWGGWARSGLFFPLSCCGRSLRLGRGGCEEPPSAWVRGWQSSKASVGEDEVVAQFY